MAQANSAQISKVDSFLLLVDKQIHSGNLGLLKLSLYASEGVAWNSLDQCQTPSDVFRLLSGDEKSALQKFIFALRAIGKKTRGTYLVQQAEKLLESSQLPSPLEFEKQSKQFRFFHWLVVVARTLPDGDGEVGEELRKRLSVKLDEHYRNFTVPALFIKLYQARIITEENSDALQDKLRACCSGKSSSDVEMLDKCRSYLQDFHTKDPVNPFTADDEGVLSKTLEQYLEKSPDAAASAAGENEHADTEVDGAQDIPLGDVSSDKRRLIRSRECNGIWSQHKLKIVVCGVILFGIVVAIIPCSVHVWAPLHEHTRSSIVQQLEGNSVILAEIDSFFVKEVTVREHVLSRDSSHKIGLYITQQSCDNIPMSTTVYEYRRHTFMNTTPTYMVAGSRIDLHTCVSTEFTSQSQVEFYIVENADNSRFNPYEAVSKPIEVGSMGREKCTNIIKEIEKSDYYYLVFLIPSKPLNISFELYMDIVTIDLGPLNSSYVSSLWYSEDTVSMEPAGWREAHCLVADIDSYEAMRPFVNTEVLFSLNYNKTLGLTLGLVIPLLLLWAICVTALCCYVKWCCSTV